MRTNSVSLRVALSREQEQQQEEEEEDNARASVFKKERGEEKKRMRLYR